MTGITLMLNSVHQIRRDPDIIQPSWEQALLTFFLRIPPPTVHVYVHTASRACLRPSAILTFSVTCMHIYACYTLT